MKIKDRIIEFKRVKASDLAPDPRNWRTHPQKQRDAMKGILSEIGYADAVLARKLPDGSLMLIDGHLRAETTPDQDIPVLVLDVNEKEAAYILATHDPVSAMAGQNAEYLDAVLRDVDSGNAAVQEMLGELYDQSMGDLGEDAAEDEDDLPDAEDRIKCVIIFESDSWPKIRKDAKAHIEKLESRYGAKVSYEE